MCRAAHQGRISGLPYLPSIRTPNIPQRMVLLWGSELEPDPGRGSRAASRQSARPASPRPTRSLWIRGCWPCVGDPGNLLARGPDCSLSASLSRCETAGRSHQRGVAPRSLQPASTQKRRGGQGFVIAFSLHIYSRLPYVTRFWFRSLSNDPLNLLSF